MIHYYAQINADSICYAVTQTAGPIDHPSMIAIASYDTELLGKQWSNGQWIDLLGPDAQETPS